MSRYIDADALKEKAHMIEIFDKQWVVDEIEIDMAPTIDAMPVVRGRWTQTNLFDEEANVYVCSVCGEPWTLNAGTPQENNMNFCPNCGAKMESECNQ